MNPEGVHSDAATATAEGGALLRPHLTTPVGTTAVYWMTQELHSQMTESAGIFRIYPLAAEAFPLPNHSIGAWVRFTVLEPDPDGNPRFAVLLLPADPHSRELLPAPSAWEGVFRIVDDESELESHVPPPADYNTIVRPTIFLLTSAQGDLPVGAILPGTTWRASHRDAEVGWELEGEATFLGWDSVGWSERQGAHVREQLAGGGEQPPDPDDELEVRMEAVVHGTHDIWMIPNDLPLGLRVELEAELKGLSPYGEFAIITALNAVVERVDASTAPEAILPLFHRGKAEGEHLFVYPHLTPAVGASASYIVVEQFVLQEGGRSGEFLETPDALFHREIQTAAFVEFHVLEPEDEYYRVAVDAVPVDPRTGLRLLLAPQWSGVMYIDPYGRALVDVAPPEEFAEVMTPAWLFWTGGRAGTFRTPVAPGDEWPMDLDVTDGMDTRMSNEFVGWQAVDWSDGEWAHLRTHFTSVTTDPVFELEYLYLVDFESTSSVWTLPWQLPVGGEMRITFETTFITLTGEAIIHNTSDITVRPRNRSTLDRIAPVTSGLLVKGAFEVDDHKLFDYTLVDVYEFQGTAGDRLTARLTSPDVDVYLYLLDDTLSYLTSDDDSLGGTDAQLEWELPYTGTYYILANQWGDLEGAYTLLVEVDSPTADSTDLSDDE